MRKLMTWPLVLAVSLGLVIPCLATPKVPLVNQQQLKSWLKDPNLTVIEIEDKTVNRISSFTLTVKQTSPNATGNESDDGGLK